MPFRRVVVGVDFSDASLAAARWATLQLAPEAEVVLAHVLPEPSAPPYLQPGLPPPAEFSAALAPAVYAGLRGLAELIGAARTTIHMTAGVAADELARAAEDFEADLICVGRGKRRDGSARFGATTAQRLLARTGVPTAVVPPGPQGAPERILAALGGGVDGARVVDTACRLASLFEARVEALHVVEDEVQELAQVAQEVRVAASESWLGEAVAERWARPHDGVAGARLLRDLASGWVEALLVASARAPARARPVVRFGDAGAQVLAHASEHGSELVVVGRGDDVPRAAHGTSSCGAGRRFVGSTTRLVAWAAPCPVLVLPMCGALIPGGHGDA